MDTDVYGEREMEGEGDGKVEVDGDGDGDGDDGNNEDEDGEDVDIEHAPLIVHTLPEELHSADGSAQEDEYDIDGSADDAPQSKTAKARRTRSYWLSKGVGM